MIPKIIHFFWGGSDMPDWARLHVGEFARLNPGYDVMMHDGSVVLPELQQYYDKLDDWAMKSDLARYSALKRYGGWYFDTDFFPFRPLNEAIGNWGLTGERMLVCRQRGHRAGDRLPFGNCPLAACKDNPGLDHIIDLHHKITHMSRTAFGPGLIKRAVEERPALYDIAMPGWWFPVSIDEVNTVYPYMVNGRHDLYLSTRGTAGARPFGAHLWAHAVDLAAIDLDDIDLRPVAVVQDARALEYIPEGLEKRGFRVIKAGSPRDHMGPIKPSLMVIWNGRRGSWVQTALENGVPYFVVEHGFFHRSRHCQCDRHNILDKASWAKRMNEPAPASGLGKLQRLGIQIPRVTARQSGPIVILGQLNGDTQLDDAEVAGSSHLVQQLGRRLPLGQRVIFRPHPLDTTPDADLLRHYPQMEIQRADRKEYARTWQSSSLDDLVRQARFVIAINSNSLVDATLLGVPCLAFGPSLGLQAGVYHRATLGSLRNDITNMMQGWTPEQDAVERYLAHLADNQWGVEDFGSPEVLGGILERVGVA